MSASAARHELEAPPQAEPRAFGPGQMMWDDFGELLTLSMSSGAFLLQAMHPTISAAVDQHSVFRTDPMGRAIRSTDSVMLWIYGGRAAAEEGRRLRELHGPIRGRTDAGEAYSALNPEAYAWVHATAFVTAVQAYPYTRGRAMDRAEQERYYAEMLQLGAILGIRAADMPAGVDEYWDYYDDMVATRLQRTLVADELLTTIRHAPTPLVPRALDPLRLGGRGLGRLLWLATLGCMTPNARDVLGERWTARDEAELRAVTGVVRPLFGRLPEALRYAPIALHARRHARAVEGIRRRATKAVA